MTREFLARRIGRRPVLHDLLGHGDRRVPLARRGEDRSSIRARSASRPPTLSSARSGLAPAPGATTTCLMLRDDLHADESSQTPLGRRWLVERPAARTRARWASARRRSSSPGWYRPDACPAFCSRWMLVHPVSARVCRTLPQAQLSAVVLIAYDCDGTPEGLIAPVGRSTPRPSIPPGILVPTGDTALAAKRCSWTRAITPPKSRRWAHAPRVRRRTLLRRQTMVDRLTIYTPDCSRPCTSSNAGGTKPWRWGRGGWIRYTGAPRGIGRITMTTVRPDAPGVHAPSIGCPPTTPWQLCREQRHRRARHDPQVVLEKRLRRTHARARQRANRWRSSSPDACVSAWAALARLEYRGSRSPAAARARSHPAEHLFPLGLRRGTNGCAGRVQPAEPRRRD